MIRRLDVINTLRHSNRNQVKIDEISEKKVTQEINDKMQFSFAQIEFNERSKNSIELITIDCFDYIFSFILQSGIFDSFTNVKSGHINALNSIISASLR